MLRIMEDISRIINKINQLNRTVYTLVQDGALEDAVLVAQESVKLAREHLSEHKVLADSLNNLAVLYQMQGSYVKAKPLCSEVLDMRKRLLEDDHPDIAQSLNNLAVIYVNQGLYSEALKLFFTALDIWKLHLGDEHEEIATSLNNIAEAYREQAQYTDAERIHLQALAMRRRLFNNLHPSIAQSLDNLGIAYENQAKYSQAEQMHLDALRMRESCFDDDKHPDIATSFNNLAALYNSQGRFYDAEANYLKALQICRDSLGAEHPYVAITLNNLANTYKNLGRYADAEKTQVSALELRKAIYGDSHIEVAQSLSSLGDIYLQQGRYQKAEQVYNQAYIIREDLLGAEHIDVALSLHNFAVLDAYQGKYKDAEQKFLQALSIYKELLGKNHPDVADNINHLGNIYQEQGLFSDAEQKYLEALAIRRHIYSEILEHPDIADSYHRIADVYRLQGRYQEAEPLYIQAYNLSKKLLGDIHPSVGAILNNLAVLYINQYQYTQAEPLLIEALLINRSQFGNKHPQVANAMSNLAALYGDMHRYSEAETIHLQALEIRKQLLGEEHPDTANTLNNLADIYFSQGRYPEAEEHYRAALSMRVRLLGNNHPDVAFSLNNLATLLAATQRPLDALSCRIQASEIHDKLISNIFAFSSENDRLALIEKIRVKFDLFLSLVNSYLAHSPNAKQAVFNFVLKRKALTLSALAAQNQALANARYRQLTEKFHQLSNLSSQIIHLTFTLPQSGNFVAHQQNLTQLQAQYNILQKQLSAQVPEIQLSQSPSNSHTVASTLPNNSVLIEFVRFDNFDFQAIRANRELQWQSARYIAFILPANQPDALQMVDLGEASIINELIAQFRTIASDSSIGTTTLGWDTDEEEIELPTKPYDRTIGIKLYQTLWRPIQTLVQNYHHLIIAPDSDLNLLPFQILPSNDTGTNFLIDKHTISYLTVGRDILKAKVKSQKAKEIQNKKIFEYHKFIYTNPLLAFYFFLFTFSLIIADPDFDLPSVVNNTCNQPNEFGARLGKIHLEREIGTRLLGESIAKKLPEARIYTDTEALETRLTVNDCPRVMLIATHGLFIPDSEYQPSTHIKLTNPMLRSALAFAGANTWLAGGNLPEYAGKGILFAQDIAGLNLWGNEITVLSACETARGDIKIGEGVFGLRRAFAVAGTKILIMSLWKVPDRATALLMERFFDNLESQMDYTQALRNAQDYIRNITVEELRKSAPGIETLKELLSISELSPEIIIDSPEDYKPLQHPFYWGAWICQGITN